MAGILPSKCRIMACLLLAPCSILFLKPGLNVFAYSMSTVWVIWIYCLGHCNLSMIACNREETCLRQPIQSLVGLGAIIVASAGNEADLRENPSGNHPPALYPAAFANPPDSINGVIP